MHLRRMRPIVALMAGAVVLLAASPAEAIKPEFERVKPHVFAHIDLGVLADGTLVAEGGDGTLVLPPDVAPPSQRAWRLSDDPAPVVEGRLNEFPQSYIDVLGHTDAQFDPIRESPRGEPGGAPGVVTVMVVPDRPTAPCVSGPGSPATADITYDDGRGRVEVLTVAARMACRSQSGGTAFRLWIWSADFATKGTARA